MEFIWFLFKKGKGSFGSYTQKVSPDIIFSVTQRVNRAHLYMTRSTGFYPQHSTQKNAKYENHETIYLCIFPCIKWRDRSLRLLMGHLESFKEFRYLKKCNIKSSILIWIYILERSNELVGILEK